VLCTQEFNAGPLRCSIRYYQAKLHSVFVLPEQFCLALRVSKIPTEVLKGQGCSKQSVANTAVPVPAANREEYIQRKGKSSPFLGVTAGHYHNKANFDYFS